MGNIWWAMQHPENYRNISFVHITGSLTRITGGHDGFPTLTKRIKNITSHHTDKIKSTFIFENSKPPLGWQCARSCAVTEIVFCNSTILNQQKFHHRFIDSTVLNENFYFSLLRHLIESNYLSPDCNKNANKPSFSPIIVDQAQAESPARIYPQ